MAAQLSFRKLLIVAALAALAVPGRSAADARADAVAVRGGLVRSLAGGWLEQREAESYWLVVRRSREVAKTLPFARRRALDLVLHDVRLQAGRYTRPRARAVFSMLGANTRYLATRGVPAARTDVLGADGALYRSFPGHGLQFHPLGNFARLNGIVSSGNVAEATRLANALVARAIPRGRGSVWEYYFAYGGGRPPWTSGMAQAAGAQALARASRLLGRPDLMTAARRAFRQAARHVIPLRVGPWTRHYSFSGIVVLNAHLQSILSLKAYAARADDAAAAELVARELRAGARLLPRFDTGSWSLYSLGGVRASLHYHLYVIELLNELARQTGAPIWRRYATRFTRYVQRRGASTTFVRPDVGELAPPLDLGKLGGL